MAVLRTLDEFGVLDGIDSEDLDAFRAPKIMNTRGEEVGAVRADFRLEDRS